MLRNDVSVTNRAILNPRLWILWFREFSMLKMGASCVVDNDSNIPGRNHFVFCR